MKMNDIREAMEVEQVKVGLKKHLKEKYKKYYEEVSLIQGTIFYNF